MIAKNFAFSHQHGKPALSYSRVTRFYHNGQQKAHIQYHWIGVMK